MTEQEALDLLDRIEREEGKRVQAAITSCGRGKKYAAVQLLLKPGQRKMLIAHLRDWEGVQAAWRQII